jgi:hypothetical protein
LDLESVFLGVDTVRGLYGQFPNPVKNVLRFLQEPFCSLNERDPVLNVPCSLIQTPNLASEFFRDRQSGSIVACAVNPHPGTQLFDVFGYIHVSETKFPVGVHSTDVVVNDHIG